MRAHRVTSRPSSFGEISIGAGPLARRATRPERQPRRSIRGRPSHVIRQVTSSGGNGPARRFRSAWWQGSVTNDRRGRNSASARSRLSLQRRISVPSSWAGFRPPGGGAPLYPIRRAGTHPRPRPTATRHHLLTDGLADGSDQQWGQLARPEITRSVRSVPLFDVAGCLQDDAPVRRASRLRTTSDGARCAH